ncbi:uncharacterized mitochondrial protein AtMg01250-like [Helianthus annuus]|uniref:uncharacterized mitochondrial protein AtMg01250-like n=1 Tax=Helianthus annuus TaxID=4232 RepID=UPI000B8FC04E|nr:uncharacterized mitochondrial protein AtMg01250-like [Helianthus annuus]
MEQMGFPIKRRLWVKGISESSQASVLVNGSPTFEFQCHRGVRQGDPLSPFIFVLAMEAFTCFMNWANNEDAFSGLTLPNNGPTISLLMYADDVLVIGEWKDKNADNLARILRAFFLMSGLKINHSKSTLVGLGVDDQEVERLAGKIRCRKGVVPLTYLGLVVGANMNLYKNWKSVIDLVEVGCPYGNHQFYRSEEG